MHKDTKKAVKVLESGTLAADNCRQWDNCWENGNGDTVLKELTELVQTNENIMKLVIQYSRFMPSKLLDSIDPFYIAAFSNY